MSKSQFRRTSVILAIVAVVLLLSFAVLSLPKQCTYRGHTVRYWTKLLWAGTPAEKTSAAEAIR
ncbi:MAG TPA: hypothetical protein VEC99_09600, partial [Clostridia bacterium]|nr:hypothetical protein [Clostridia bacterium]